MSDETKKKRQTTAEIRAGAYEEGLKDARNAMLRQFVIHAGGDVKNIADWTDVFDALLKNNAKHEARGFVLALEDLGLPAYLTERLYRQDGLAIRREMLRLYMDVTGDFRKMVEDAEKATMAAASKKAEEKAAVSKNTAGAGDFSPNAAADGTGLNQFEKFLVNTDKVIEAIKAVRARTNLGLKESKDLVDAYRHRNDQNRF